LSDILHIIQDLRADAHRVPPDVAATMREAAQVLDRYKHFLKLAGDDGVVRGAPIPPPLHDDPRRRRVKGAPCQ
jgi:hypothetical protein